MRSARRASPPRRPDPPAIPRSTLQHPTCGRLQKPPVGSQSFAHSFADLSLPPITSRATPHLGSKITIVRTATVVYFPVDDSLHLKASRVGVTARGERFVPRAKETLLGEPPGCLQHHDIGRNQPFVLVF